MPTLKEYNVKLARLRSTRKLTRTMKLVSVTKLRRAQEAEKRLLPFVGKIRHLAARLTAEEPRREHPLLLPARNPGTILLLIVTADRGLCGSFNSTLLKAAMEWIRDQGARSRHVVVHCCGRRGYAYLRSRATVGRFYEEAVAYPTFLQACRIGQDIQTALLAKRIDEAYVAWNAVKGLLGYSPQIERLAPLDSPPAGVPAERDESPWILEPDRDALLDAVVPWMINLKVYTALLGSASGEHGARMRAMDQASTNADNLIRQTLLQRNRARQAAITTELTEIVAGAEALR